MAPPLYRDYDQAGLDGQLNLRARWPEHGEIFARWARDSAAARAMLPARLDLAYGATGGQRLDLFPAGARAPLVAFIHGGFWQALDKGDFSYLAPAFVRAGVAFASINYDLAPQVSVAEIVTQVRRALAWLHDRAAALDIDAGRLFVAGHSAGGHLSAMALSTDWAGEWNLRADPVRGACSVSGIYELEPLRLSYHQAVLALDPSLVEVLSPMRHPPRGRGPLICAVGSEETEEFRVQQAELVAAWGAAGCALRIVELPGRNHFTAVDALGEAGHALFAALRDLVLERP